MPRRTDIESICVIGSGPIVIGQACEFAYAGCQALKVLREEGFRTIVVNSNPATIMTDPGFADRTYIEPLDLEGVASVLERERPDALLPTLGGQTALNLAVALAEAGGLAEPGAAVVGAPGAGPRASGQARRPRLPRRRADRRPGRGHPPRGGPRAVPPGRPQLRTARSRFEDRHLARGAGGGAPAGRGAARLHPGRARRRVGRRSRGAGSAGRARARRVADPAGAGRGVGAGLGRVRAGGDPRPRGQRRRRLLDR